MKTFCYKNSENEECIGEVNVLTVKDPLEMEIKANGWTFHTIVGSQANGNYICIPNWSIGSEYAQLDDEFWNAERLLNYTTLDKDNVNAVVRAIADVNSWLNEINDEECG